MAEIKASGWKSLPILNPDLSTEEVLAVVVASESSTSAYGDAGRGWAEFIMHQTGTRSLRLPSQDSLSCPLIEHGTPRRAGHGRVMPAL